MISQRADKIGLMAVTFYSTLAWKKSNSYQDDHYFMQTSSTQIAILDKEAEVHLMHDFVTKEGTKGSS